MNLTYKQLEAFFFSAKLQSFSAAAAKLHTTQSAISKRVAELEAALGVPVLHRTPRGLEVTQGGRRLLPLAEESQRLWQRIESELSASQSLKGAFRIGVTELIAMTWLTSFVKRIQGMHPEVLLEPVVDAGLTLFGGLEANKIDVVIIPGTYWGNAFTTTKVGQVEELWVASPALKVPKRPLKPHEFALYPMLEQSTGAAKNRFYESWLAEHGFTFNKVFATNSTTVLRQLTISGFGISQLALDYVRPDIKAGLLRIVRSDPMPPPMVYSAVYRKDNFSTALERIVELAVETCDFSLRRGSSSSRATDISRKHSFNAINLALDAIWRFAGMPRAYYLDWLQVAAEEAKHFSLLNAHLRSMGWAYGDFPAHTGLWDMTHKTRHDITARMALVPRTLEARGLDATPPMQAKLRRVSSPDALRAVDILDVILRDEVGHVAIGNHWYRWLCERDGLDPVAHDAVLTQRYEAPRLRPPFNTAARLKGGFTATELTALQGKDQEASALLATRANG